MFTALLLCLAQDPTPLKNANGPFEPAEAVKHLFVPPSNSPRNTGCCRVPVSSMKNNLIAAIA